MAPGPAQRLGTTYLSMIGVTVLLTAVVAVGAWWTGFVHFGADRSSRPVQTVNAGAVYTEDARSLGIDIRNPEVPEGWVATSARILVAGDKPVSTVGYVIDNEAYLEVQQTAADVDALRGSVDGEGTNQVVRTHTGDVESGGVTWQVWTTEGGDPDTPGSTHNVWIGRVGSTSVAVKGQAGEENFRTLTERVATAEPVKSSSALRRHSQRR